jgi:hypothetical protein
MVVAGNTDAVLGTSQELDNATPETSLATPGWYPDPDGSSALRYWDGQRWVGRSPQRASTPPTPLPAVPASPSATNPVQRRVGHAAMVEPATGTGTLALARLDARQQRWSPVGRAGWWLLAAPLAVACWGAGRGSRALTVLSCAAGVLLVAVFTLAAAGALGFAHPLANAGLTVPRAAASPALPAAPADGWPSPARSTVAAASTSPLPPLPAPAPEPVRAAVPVTPPSTAAPTTTAPPTTTTPSTTVPPPTTTAPTLGISGPSGRSGTGQPSPTLPLPKGSNQGPKSPLASAIQKLQAEIARTHAGGLPGRT